MNIGFDAKRLYNNFTGLGNYSRTLVKNLHKFFPENSYWLYSTRVKHNNETDFFSNHNEIKTFVPKTFSNAYWRSFSILNQLKRNNIDLFHGLSHEIPFSISKSGIKSIVTIHDLIFKVYPKTYSTIDRAIYNSKFLYSCKNADLIIAISKSTRKDIIKYFNIEPSKIEVVYQSCDPLFAQHKTKEEIDCILKQYRLPHEYLLYVGSVIERKNLNTIIESYSYLPESSKLPLVVIGKGKEYMASIKEKVSQLKMEQRIIWVDNLYDNSHLQAVYQQASVFIYPSIYEGFGIPVIEALLSRTPVITSNTSSLPEAGGPFSFYIDPLDAEQMAHAIEKILNDSLYRDQMVEKGYNFAINTFNEKVVTEKLMEVYKKVLEK